jgi:hypothetical protein
VGAERDGELADGGASVVGLDEVVDGGCVSIPFLAATSARQSGHVQLGRFPETGGSAVNREWAFLARGVADAHAGRMGFSSWVRRLAGDRRVVGRIG